MEAEIREAVPDDVPSLEIIRRQAIESGFSDEYDRDGFAPLVAEADANLPEWVTDDATLVLVAETEITPVCFGVYERDESTISALYTAPDYQHHGCASALVDRFEREGRRLKADAIQVTAPRNAVPFFEKVGFDYVGERRRVGLDFVVLQKSIV